MATAIGIGTLVQLSKAVGPWNKGAKARVIPNPIKTIPYSEVNSTGERKEFNGTIADSVWIIMQNEQRINAIPKFSVDLSELEVVGK